MLIAINAIPNTLLKTENDASGYKTKTIPIAMATSDVSNTVTDTINGVANSNNISRDSISVENS